LLCAYENTWLTVLATDAVSEAEASGLRTAAVSFLRHSLPGLQHVLSGVPGLAEACGLGQRAGSGINDEARLMLLELSIKAVIEHNMRLSQRVQALERRVAASNWPASASSMETVE